MLERKVGGVSGKEVTDPRTFTSLFSPSSSQTDLMPQEIPSVSLDADRYIAHPVLRGPGFGDSLRLPDRLETLSEEHLYKQVKFSVL